MKLKTGIVLAGLGLAQAASGGPLSIAIPASAPASAETFHLGTARRPDGGTLTLDSRSLRLDGRPDFPFRPHS